ncbi:MAG: hypothetical protein R3F50_09220 [Gammaproteobacteria bacterium]|jgi:hypothetical protein
MILRILMTLTIPVALIACEEEGPAERFGEQIDEAAYQVEDSARDAADRVSDAANDAGNAIEDACEDVTNRNC